MTFEHWWDRPEGCGSTPDTYKGWENSCRVSYKAGAADSKEEIESLRQQLSDSQKREVMLRDALEYHQAQTRPIQRTEEALAATADLDGLILCEKKPVAYMAVDSQGGSLFFRNEVLTIKTIPLYIALDQK